MPSSAQYGAEERRPNVRHARVGSPIDALRQTVEALCDLAPDPAAYNWRLSLALIERCLQPNTTVTTTELRDGLAGLGCLSQTLHKALALRPDRDPIAGTLAGTGISVDGGISRDRRARHRVWHQDFTSLPDRHDFRDRLRLALGRAAAQRGKLAVLLVRIEGLDSMALSFGTSVSDAVLRIVGERLRHALRSGDVVRCVAGDEVACLIANLSAHEPLGSLARKVFDAVAAPMLVGSFEYRLRPAIGIAMSPANGTTASALLKRADTAMNRAQHARTGFAFFDPSSPS